METYGTIHSPGSHMKEFAGPAISSAVAAGSGDNTAVNGAVIDRLPAGAEEYDGLVALGIVTVNVSGSDTCAFSLKVQHGDASNGSDMADYTDQFGRGAIAPTISADGTSVHKLTCSLAKAKRYVRLVGLVNLSAGATDTASFTAAALLSSAMKSPQ